MSTTPHPHRAVVSVRCIIITISDTRTEPTDASGTLIRERLETAGHVVLRHRLVTDDPAKVSADVGAACDDPSCEAVILTGGTGIAPRDSTFEALAPLLEKTLDGFGELFRALSYPKVGAAAMLSRALAGVRGSTVIFSLPGSTPAVRLAMDELILPELGHIVGLLRPTRT